MLFIEDGQVWESFVYVPKKPIAINPDGSWNTQKVCELVVKAKAGDEQAIMQLFEQYQYLWKATINGFTKAMIEYEDAQQDVFVTFMEALNSFHEDNPDAFSGYLKSALDYSLTKKTVEEYVYKKHILFSLDERDENGNLMHDLPDTSVQEYIPDFKNIRKMLNKREYGIVIAHYYFGIPLQRIARHYKISYKHIRVRISEIRKKLKVLL